MRQVVVIDGVEQTAEIFPSVSAAARSVGRDVSTVHRALTHDRNAQTTAEGKVVVDLKDALAYLTEQGLFRKKQVELGLTITY